MPHPMISIQNLSKAYPSGFKALDTISFSIQPGEIFGIIGRSGAGKSTLVRCMNLLERPSAGKVLIGKQELTALSNADLFKARQKIGMIFQHFNLLSSRTVLENILLSLEIANWPKKQAKQRALELLSLVQLADKTHNYPYQLSGGEKQRVAIARALANHPDILLCDEATSALDPETTVSILNLLKEINQKLGITLVLITHEMDVIKNIAHRAAVLEKGKLVELAKTIDIFTRPQATATQELIRASLHLELPAPLKNKLFKSPASGSVPLLRLCFVGDQVDQPILSEISKTFGVKANILQATLQWIGEIPMGVTICELLGEKSSEALSYLRENNIQVEVLGYVSGH